nr:MAG TPA: hypothetical protein [Caudoviricetes sp.]
MIAKPSAPASTAGTDKTQANPIIVKCFFKNKTDTSQLTKFSNINNNILTAFAFYCGESFNPTIKLFFIIYLACIFQPFTS